MLTISQVASYAGVTVRAVRHYHQIGLLPEPERDRSGYRSYDAAALVRLIRIHTLADAGVPLARVQELLDAAPDEFARSIKEIDRGLRAEMRRLRENRKRIARLADGESLALPRSVLDYLDRLRGLGVDEEYIALERDGWIMVAAHAPDEIDDIIAMKHRELDDPDTVLLYKLINEAIHWPADDPRIVEIVDVMERIVWRAAEAGQLGETGDDDRDQPFVDLLDALPAASPGGRRVIALLEERGWKGWTRIEQVPPRRLGATGA
ncbi:MerR family transcriptional regulator [Promicromonospora panici]|uniref:MerR family transcriptional regulator n=1 Tax=Promicromonospora panici TaxID=2219658 RepID=UPI00101C2D83|nr:MerR family transcriptional regulator [Promicromonospora panici]